MGISGEQIFNRHRQNMKQKRLKLTRLELRDITYLVLFALLCLALSVALWSNFSKRNAQSVQTFFERNVADVQATIAQRMQLYEYGVRGVRGAVSAVGFNNLNRANFLDYVGHSGFRKGISRCPGFWSDLPDTRPRGGSV
jgi:hypothetical protein